MVQIPGNSEGKLDYPQEFIPKVEDLWVEASPLQQLNWLWQIAKLWKPLEGKNVAGSLLDPELIRVNGQIVQLLQLRRDGNKGASLQELGNLWSKWSKQAHPTIRQNANKISWFDGDGCR